MQVLERARHFKLEARSRSFSAKRVQSLNICPCLDGMGHDRLRAPSAWFVTPTLISDGRI